MTKQQLYKRLATIAEAWRQEQHVRNLTFYLFGNYSETMINRQLYPRNPRFYPKSKVRRWWLNKQKNDKTTRTCQSAAQ